MFGLGSTQFPQKLYFCIKRVHFEAHIYRNSKEERILRLIKEEQIWGLFTKEEIKSRFWGPFTKMVEEQILRLIFHQLRRRLSVTIIRAQSSCLLRRHGHFQPSLVLGKQPKHVLGLGSTQVLQKLDFYKPYQNKMDWRSTFFIFQIFRPPPSCPYY